MCSSDTSSLGAPVLGAEACLDAFEAVFCICWKTRGPKLWIHCPAWSRACREACPGLLERWVLASATVVLWELMEQQWGVLETFYSSLWAEVQQLGWNKSLKVVLQIVVHSPSGCEELYNICWLLIKSTNFAEKLGLSGFSWFLFAWWGAFGAFLLLWLMMWPAGDCKY